MLLYIVRIIYFSQLESRDLQLHNFTHAYWGRRSRHAAEVPPSTHCKAMRLTTLATHQQMILESRYTRCIHPPKHKHSTCKNPCHPYHPLTKEIRDHSCPSWATKQAPRRSTSTASAPLRILRPLRETQLAFRERSIRVIREIRGKKNQQMPQVKLIVARYPCDGTVKEKSV